MFKKLNMKESENVETILAILKANIIADAMGISIDYEDIGKKIS